jgi:CHAT domain-containing protein/Tfp pilus assembly protein PilF
MCQIERSLLTTLAVCVLLSCWQGETAAQSQEARILELGKTVERELAGEQSHNYLIELAANDFLHVIVEQRGVDVVVGVYAPDGKKLKEVDSPNGTEGPEPVLLIAETAGAYRLEVRSLEKGAAGKYAVTLTSKRTATTEDREQLAKQALLEQAQALSNQAASLSEQGRFKDAVSLAERSLAIREKALGPEHPDVAIALIGLAEQYKATGDYTRAIPLVQRAVAIFEKVWGEKHANVATALNNLALLYQATGDYARAEPLLQRALAIYEKVLPPDHPDVATALINLAGLYHANGYYARAAPLYQRALAIREKVLGPEHPDVAIALNELAVVYQATGDYAHAEPLLQRALAISEKVLPPEHPEVATALNNLAVPYHATGDYARAAPLYQRALAIREKVLGPDHPDVAQSLNNLAALSQDTGDYARAASLFQHSLAILEKALGPEHPDVASSLNNLANLYQATGDYALAEPRYKRALTIREKVWGPEHPDVALTLDSLAGLYLAIGDYTRAMSFEQSATDARERNIAAILDAGSQQQKQLYLDTLSGETNTTISLHAKNIPQNGDAARLAVTTILRRKGRALDAFTGQLEALRRRATPADKRLLDDLAAVQSQLANLQLGGSRLAPDAQRAEVARLTTEQERLEDTISRRSAEFRAVRQPITLERVQAAVPADSALVELFVYQPFNAKAKTKAERFGAARYVAYVVRHSQAVPQFVDLGEAVPMDAAAAQFRNALKSPKTPEMQVKQLARDLDARLTQPIRMVLGATKRVLLAPDGALNLIPFETLVDENGRYLIESYSFNYLTSGRDLLRLQVTGKSESRASIVANPQFDLTQPVVKCRTEQRSPGLSADLRDGKVEYRGTDFTKLCYSTLAGTAQEGAELVPLLSTAQLLTQKDATEAALKSLHRPRILHIATHGFFLPDRPQVGLAGTDQSRGTFDSLDTPLRASHEENPLLRSGLILAGVNQRSSGPGEDGVLTALEAAALDLFGTKLVVLSACETGLGDVQNGQGVYGLRRALVLAGSETQIMSLWKVSDDATRVLMVAYYKRLQVGEGRVAAMRAVQLEMLRGQLRSSTNGESRGTIDTGEKVVRKDYRHPFYWAAFIPSGDWRNLDGK